MNDIKKKLFKGGVWLSGARFLITSMQAITTIVAAWFLSPEDFGLVAIAMTLLVILNALSEMQLGEALIRHSSTADSAVHTIWTLSCLRGLFIAGFLAALAFPVAQVYGDERLFVVILVLGLQPIFGGIENPKRFLQIRNLNFIQEFLITVLQKLIGIAVIIGVAFWFQSYWALIIGPIAERAAGTIISYILLSYRPKISFVGVREIWGFSLWLNLSQIVNTINFRIEFLLIGKFLGLTQLGLYRVGTTLAQLPTMEFIQPIKKVVYPGFFAVLSDPVHGHEAARIRSAFRRAQSLTLAIILPAGVGLSLTAETVVALILDDQWSDTTFILQYLAAMFAFQTVAHLDQPLAMAKNRTFDLFVRSCQMLFIYLPLIVLGLIYMGLFGVIIARVVSGFIGVSLSLVLIKRLIGLTVLDQLRATLRPLGSVSIMAVFVMSVSSAFELDGTVLTMAARLTAEISVGVMTYFAATFSLWYVMGRPSGPETELLGLVQSVVRKRSES